MDDLFINKTKKQQLLEYIQSRNWTLTHTVDEWGLKNHHIRARRDAQEFCQQGLIKRMAEDEFKRIFGNRKEGAWTP